MNRKKLALLAFILFCSLGTGCSRSSPTTAGASSGNGKPPVAVEVIPARLGEFVESIEVVGTLTPKFHAEVKTEYSGIISEVYVTEWVRVRKGAPLARLDSREEEAQVAAARAAVLQAAAVAQRAAREYERAVKLRGVGLATQQGVDEAHTAKEAADASHEAARAQLQALETRLAKTLIRAPMAGVIAERLVNVGDLVENMGSPKPMFRIVDNRLLELTLTVPSTKLAALRVGQPLTFETGAFPGRVFRGQVSYINPAAEEVSRSVKLIAEVSNPSEELKAGLFVEGQIITGRRPRVLRVPRTALLGWDITKQEAMLFVVKGDSVQRRTVKTGATSGDWVEITSGVQVEEPVVSGGAFNLQDGDRVSVTPAKEA